MATPKPLGGPKTLKIEDVDSGPYPGKVYPPLMYTISWKSLPTPDVDLILENLPTPDVDHILEKSTHPHVDLTLEKSTHP
ncbi:hypothetical protein TNCV_2320491 [Trichonephila clavipes]|nr:hypothetical protein TNCV_2320491 [Trichonephila clavipes]